MFPTDDQSLFARSVDRYLAGVCDGATRRRVRATGPGFAEEHWRGLAELGVLGLLVAEDHGGTGGGAGDVAVVMEAIGRHLLAGPFFATGVLGAALLAGADGSVRSAVLPELVAGRHRVSLAFVEPQARYDLADVTTRAARDGAGWRIDGAKSLVSYATAASSLVVVARTRGGRAERDGIGLFLVPGDAPGIERRDYPTLDGQRASEVTLEGVRVGAEAAIGDPEGGLDVLERVIDLGTAALLAEAVGAMSYLYETTLAYLKTRKQFGTTIGSFQALQHRMVDVFTQVEFARSMAAVARLALDGDDATRRREVSAGKLFVDRAARHVAQESIQLHGGMGMTDELDVGHYAKRLTMIGLTFGDRAHHLARYGAARRPG
ncbi:MAG: acyl-CoA dehydrogenase family protein [Alphaproteobacteria bacterium]